MLAKIIKRLIVLIMIMVPVLTGCKTTVPIEDNQNDQVAETAKPVDSNVETATENPTPDETTQDKPQEDFVVTDEIFQDTFEKVDVVISQLNSLIRAKEFEKWKTYLTDDYIRTFSDPVKLAELSQSERLKSAGIELKTLKDYFLYVVVPSRANLRLDDLVFITENQVEAIMIIRDQRISVYKLRLIDNQWKIEG